MQYLLLVYIDDSLTEALPDGQYDTMMHDCFVHPRMREWETAAITAVAQG